MANSTYLNSESLFALIGNNDNAINHIAQANGGPVITVIPVHMTVARKPTSSLPYHF